MCFFKQGGFITAWGRPPCWFGWQGRTNVGFYRTADTGYWGGKDGRVGDTACRKWWKESIYPRQKSDMSVRSDVASEGSLEGWDTEICSSSLTGPLLLSWKFVSCWENTCLDCVISPESSTERSSHGAGSCWTGQSKPWQSWQPCPSQPGQQHLLAFRHLIAPLNKHLTVSWGVSKLL